MRKENFKPNDFFHIVGSGAGGSQIFIDDQDKSRFLFLITHLQSPLQIYNTYWYADKFIERGQFRTKEHTINKIIKNRHINLLVFAITENSFQILVQNLSDSILSVYMQRVLTAYSKYFNAKYKKRGHVFNGPFEATFVKNNRELSEMSAQIHKFITDYKTNPFSSYLDYIDSNRWGDLLQTNIILKQFKNQTQYRDFVTAHKEFI